MKHKHYMYFGMRAMTICFALLVFTSCEKFVEVGTPETLVLGSQVYSNDVMATSAIVGYGQMLNSQGFASGSSLSVTGLCGRSSDEFQNYSNVQGDNGEFSVNSINATNISLKSYLWADAFKYVYFANLVMENLQISKSVSAFTSKQLNGEARFVRAFCHFYLTNMFGEIPIVTTTDYKLNNSSSRKSIEEVYDQIILDLREAEELLSDDYPTEERVRPNKWTAKALLARVYLYKGDWANAEALSTEVILNTNYSLMSDLNDVFLANSSESIFQLKPVSKSLNTLEGQYFILTAKPSQVALSTEFLNAIEPADARLANWIGTFTDGINTYHYPFKYKIKTGAVPLREYSMVLRLGEQYLIRAEARAREGNTTGALEDLNAIRERAGLLPSATADQSALLFEIEQERRVELFSEWGHRWFDLKRTGRADAVLSPVKGTTWQSTDVLYPIPRAELLVNPNLSPQNAGY